MEANSNSRHYSKRKKTSPVYNWTTLVLIIVDYYYNIGIYDFIAC
jgi:hypothetical protein